MKIESVLIDVSVYPQGVNRPTSMLTAEHAPELMPDGWVRFLAYGQWHLVPPHAVKRVTLAAEVVAEPVNELAKQPVVVKRGRPVSRT